MISTAELHKLTESDVGRRLLDPSGLMGWVRIENRPLRRVVVDFSLRVSEQGRVRDLRVGTWPELELADIRRAGERLRALSEAPSATRREAAAPPDPAARPQPFAGAPVPATALMRARTANVRPAAGATLKQLFERWSAEALATRKDAGQSVRRSLSKDVLPLLGDLPAAQIRQQQIVTVLEQIVARGSARQAGSVLSDLRQMFRFGAEIGLVDTDPTYTLRKAEFGGPPSARHRTLTDAEIQELSARMSAARLARHVRRAIWLMLATGTRIGEVSRARWQDVDLENRTWTIPAEFSHSGRVQQVPLSAFALSQVLSEFGTEHSRAAVAHRRSDIWVFPGRYKSEALSAKALGKQIRDRQRGSHIRGRASGTTTLLLPGGAWTPLDLRRTAASMMAQLGVRPDVIGACLDHSVRGDAQRVYHREPSIEERRQALDQLGARLEALLSHPNQADPGRRAA